MLPGSESQRSTTFIIQVIAWNIALLRFACNENVGIAKAALCLTPVKCDSFVGMKSGNEQQNRQEVPVRSDENLACEVCGRFGAFRIGDRVLCEDCYEGCGSCCPEFGKDDLWTFSEDK